MPVARNPLKHQPIASKRERMAMVQLLIQEEPKMAFSDLEIIRGGKSYAVDTVEQLQAAQPGQYWFIVGADALKDISQWKQPERLLLHCRIAAAVRPPVEKAQVLARVPEALRDKVDLIDLAPMDTASFDLRDRLARNKPVAPMLPDRVLDYIRENKLYRS